MQKTTHKIRSRYIRLTKIRTWRHYKRKNRHIKRKKRFIEFNKISAPTYFALTYNEKHRNSVLKFIDKLTKSIQKRKKTIIDFSSTEKMFTCGTLLFAAELRNALNVNRSLRPIVRCCRSHNNKVMEVLEQIGVLGILKYRKKIVTQSTDVINWKFVSGNSVTGENYDDILSHVDGRLTETKQKEFYVGITEAMANTHHHAYILSDVSRPVAKQEESWWAFSQIKDGRLCVVFCDLGIGIPKSLPIKQPSWHQKILSKFKTPNDANLIEQATEISVSRTGQTHRGKGLRQFVKVVEGVPKSFLLIHSDRGKYGIDNGQKGTYLYGKSINGTIIEWSMPIQTAGESKDELH